MRNPVTFVVGLVILLIFGSISFLFQVRESEVAFLTTFGKADEAVEEVALLWSASASRIFRSCSARS